MKAPEKIKIGKYNITSDGDVLFAWVTNEPDCEAMQHDIEYIRADAFIEKACEWLKENKDKYLYNTGGKYEYIPTCSGKMIDDFRKYMKGED